MIDRRASLAAVVRHAVDLEADYDDIEPTLTALTESGDTTLVPLLHEALDRFLDERNFYGRDLVAGILAGIQGGAALPVLLRAAGRDLGDDQDGLRTEIIELLHGDPDTARRTVLEFAGADTAELRREGLWALGFLTDARDTELLAAAATDPDPRVRSMAIGSIHDPAGDDRAFRTLVLALRDADEQVRTSAISRLGGTGRVDAVAPLAALATAGEPRVRSLVAYALGQIGSAEATPALLRLHRDPDRHVRDTARNALGSVGGPAAVDPLLALAAHLDPEVRARAAVALAKAVDSDPRVIPALTTLAEDGEPAVRAATVGGLAGAGKRSPHLATLVVGLANDPDPAVRQRVALAVRHLAPDAAADILHRYADDPDQTVRRIAGNQLEHLAGPADR
ncbi:HEAT repeat domain-containing protein [Polymorphospora sp. NPDC051019]|uniref:HEAT repeat domain-containing protein n=1 Tax=Polymorphospora sp. NPDC051019 TaxID=3155725 RepID=UPI0034379A15